MGGGRRAMRPPAIILASASPRRQELLKRLGCSFETVPAQIAEVDNPQLTAWEIARSNAVRKACRTSLAYPDQIVLGADTVVVLGVELYGKPRDRSEARGMLERLAGRTHHVVTGICLLRRGQGRQRVTAVSSEVTLRPLTRETIDLYLQRVDPLDKAGGYAIQEHGQMIIEKVEGSVSNVIGLPLEQLQSELASGFGWRPGVDFNFDPADGAL